MSLIIQNNEEKYRYVSQSDYNHVEPEEIDTDFIKNSIYTHLVLPKLELKDLLAFRISSTNFRSLANSQIIYRLANKSNTGFKFKKEIIDSEFIENSKAFFGEQCSEISVLNFNSSKFPNYNFLENFPNLLSLGFKSSNITDADVQNILKCKKVQWLHIKDTKIENIKFLEELNDLKTIKVDDAITIPQLLELRASSDNGRRIANRILVKRLNKQPSLINKLKIDRRAVTLKEILDFFGKSQSKIKHLYLSDFNWLKDFKALSSLKKLQSLYLFNAKATELNSLSHCKNLESLEIRHCLPLENIDNVSWCDKLKSFKLSQCLKITNSLLDSLQYCKSLEKLFFEQCNLPQLNSFRHSNLKKMELALSLSDLIFVQNFSNLQSVTFNHYSTINISSLKSSLSLKKIEFLNCKKILLGNLQQLPGLEEVKLTKPIAELSSASSLPKKLSISDWKIANLSFITDVYAHAVESICFSNCKNIDLGSLNAFINLQSIKFVSCRNFDLSLLDKLPILDSLEFDRCGEPLNAFELDFDFEGLESIRHLKISHFDVNDSFMFKCFPNLKTLSLSNLKITELYALEDLHLDTLSIFDCDMSEMAPFEYHPCRNLIINGNVIPENEENGQ